MNGCATLSQASHCRVLTSPHRPAGKIHCTRPCEMKHWFMHGLVCRALVGETHVLVHSGDLVRAATSASTVVITPAESRYVQSSATSDASSSDGGVIPHTVRCARCECPLGSVVCQLSLSAQPPDDASLRFHKDRLHLSTATASSNMFHKYTVATRLFTELVDRAEAHTQYRFLLHACDAVTGAPDAPINAVHSHDGPKCDDDWVMVGLKGTGLRGRLVLMNWNAAMVACDGGRPEHAHDALPEVPALKLAYEILEDDPDDAKLKHGIVD